MTDVLQVRRGAALWATLSRPHALNGLTPVNVPARSLRLQAGMQLREVRVAGTSNAGGGPLLVMDIAAAQDLFGRTGQLSRMFVNLIRTAAETPDERLVFRVLGVVYGALLIALPWLLGMGSGPQSWVLQAMGAGSPAQSTSITITAPDIAENGAVVPLGGCGG